MSASNGTMPKPAVTVHYDPESQVVSLKVDPEQVKNWSFAAAILEMAKGSAEQAVKMAQFEAMKQAQVQATIQQKILSKLHM